MVDPSQTHVQGPERAPIDSLVDPESLTPAERDASGFGLLALDPAGTVLDCNRSAAALTGFPAEAMIGRNYFRDLVPSAGVPGFYGRFLGALRRGGPAQSFEFVFGRSPAPLRARIGLRPGAGATRAPATNYRAPRAAPVAGTRADLRISFQLGSDQMTDVGVSKARIFAQAAALPELTGKRFLIEGHTDSLGNYASNVDLSRRRAQAVADYLVAQGVDRSRLEVKGTGPDAPLAGRTKTDPANRRVEAQLLP